MAELANKEGHPWRDVAITAVVLLALAAAPALAATVTTAPTVTGDPTPGFVLTASSGQWTPATATPNYDWLRCNASGTNCTRVGGACERQYTVRDADVGHTLRARLTVTEADQPPALAVSDPTARVRRKRYSIPTGPDSDAACVLVTPTGHAQGTFTSGGVSGAGTTPAPTTALAFIDPFPVVRIAGRFKGSRTKLTRVTVRAPRGVRIRLTCKGRGCPYRRRAVAAKLVAVRSLQRTYRPRTTIEIRVTQAGKIGKYTRVKTRSGKAPLRIDRCLMPGSTRPVRCPGG
jgi:hypothetical protein